MSSIKRGIDFVEFVEERNNAHVAVSITIINDLSQGNSYFIAFTGHEEFLGDNDRIDYPIDKELSGDDLNAGLSNRIQMGLMRYVGKTSQKNQMSIQFLDSVKPTAVIDKWNFWVFSFSGNTFLDGQQLYKSGTLFGSVSAARVTPELKIRLSVGGMFSKNTFTFENTVIESKSDSKNFNGLFVKSLDEHWSIGAYLGVTSSSFGNTRFSLSPAPAIEYNVFKYSESTKKELRFLYRIGFNWNDYIEETIYEKTNEKLFKESLSVTLEFKQKWGTVSTSLEGSHYFHDFSKNRIEFNGDLSLRLMKGLNFNVDLSYSRIRDQLSLPRGGASYEEILLRRKELGTSYRYRISVGLSFTFGSTQSRVVNPRFGSGSGGIQINL
ncbi:hypothetical protein ACFLT9_04745 [Acidobacteriota bacterium]